MEFDENNGIKEREDDYVEIYSKKAIWWFSILASPLFGGILLVLNLKSAGYKRAMYTVLAFVILYALVTNILINEYISVYKIDINKAVANGNNSQLLTFCGIVIGFNIIGGLILTQYFFRKYFPDDDYYPKSVATPIFITVLIMLVLKLLGFGGLGL